MPSVAQSAAAFDRFVRPLERAHRTIALKKDEHHAMMLQSHPEWADRIEYWSVHDIDCAHPDQALPQIEKQVLELMRTLRI